MPELAQGQDHIHNFACGIEDLQQMWSASREIPALQGFSAKAGSF